MLRDDYTEATYQCIEDGMSTGDALEKLRALLEKRGHESLYPGILRTLLRFVEVREVKDMPVVTIANESSHSTLKKEITEALKALGTEDAPNIVCDERLVGGFHVRYQDKAVDNSYKQRLLTLYRNITA